MDQTALPGTTTGAHGILEGWAVAGHILDIASIVTSGIAILIIVGCSIWDRIFLSRVPFRLTLWLAISSVLFSACRIVQYNNTAMERQSEIRLRVITWLTVASELCIVTVCLFISVHLILTVHLHRLHAARRIQAWYDAAAVVCSLLIAHPVLYIYQSARWDADMHTVLFDDQVFLNKPTVWAVYLAWVALGIVACLGASAFVIHGAFFARTKGFLRSPNSPSLASSTTNMCNSSSSNNTVDAHRTSKLLESATHPWEELRVAPPHSDQQKAIMQPVTLRVACYSLLPLLTQIWPIAYAMAPRDTWWLYRMAFVAPSMQGIFCLMLLAANPACEELWQTIYDWVFTRRHCDQEALNANLNLEFANLNASTIHLSPYQSRQASLSPYHETRSE
ncbi:hypothetical protein LPJ59_001821 [Coemansia sp. RSA 2399]|nr:hypothetical protein LPJ59_001821 [Coemansia sp. RSA 2399]KAJ1906115.1 hypothetical protein LPJ81_001529 [Coemansia sp. IMI 209127]